MSVLHGTSHGLLDMRHFKLCYLESPELHRGKLLRRLSDDFRRWHQVNLPCFLNCHLQQGPLKCGDCSFCVRCIPPCICESKVVNPTETVPLQLCCGCSCKTNLQCVYALLSKGSDKQVQSYFECVNLIPWH